MIYEYKDEFLIDSIETEELEYYEQEAIKEVDKLNITDDFYKEKLVVNRVYMLCAKAQLEADGMQQKYNIYEKEYKRFLKDAMLFQKGQDGILDEDTIYTVKLGRS